MSCLCLLLTVGERVYVVISGDGDGWEAGTEGGRALRALPLLGEAALLGALEISCSAVSWVVSWPELLDSRFAGQLSLASLSATLSPLPPFW